MSELFVAYMAGFVFVMAWRNLIWRAFRLRWAP